MIKHKRVYYIVSTMFILLCIERAGRFFWHGLQILHPYDIPIAIIFLWGWHFRKSIRRIGRSASKILKISHLLIIICTGYLVYLFLIPTAEYLPNFDSEPVLAPLVKLWPYLQLAFWSIIGMHFVSLGYANKLRKVIILGSSLFIIVFLYRVAGFPNISPSRLHSAFMGMITHFLLAVCVYLIVLKKDILKRISLSLIGIVLLFIPILGALRGASFGAILVASIAYALSSRKSIKSKLSVLVPLVFSLILFIALFRGRFSTRFREENPYGYSTYSQVITRGFTPETATAQLRLNWWSASFEVLEKSPLVGWNMTYKFRRTPSSPITPARGVHNFFVSAFLDGGLILFAPIVLLFMIPLFRGYTRIRSGEIGLTIPFCWLLAIIIERMTNTFSYGLVASRISAVVFGYCVGILVVPSNGNVHPSINE